MLDFHKRAKEFMASAQNNLAKAQEKQKDGVIDKLWLIHMRWGKGS